MVLYVKILWDVVAILSLMISEDYSIDVPFMMVTSSSAELLEPVCCQSFVALFVHTWDIRAIFHSPSRRAWRIFPCSLLKGEFQNLKSL